jgi:GT2 family glycosyltransferase
VVVVDNNSTDFTAAVVQEAMRRRDNVRYLFESRQGLASARNAGIQAARAPIVAFTDDDVRVADSWIDAIATVFGEIPDADWIGGKVLPQWPTPPPAWLTRAAYAPLALVDHGDEGFSVSADRRICLVGANLAVRRRVFDRVGLFDPRVERRRDVIGSTEDHELHLRMWEAGLSGRYDPRLVVHADIALDRLSKAYHRAWHHGHGRFYALMREPSFERSRRRLFDVPAHVFRAIAAECCACVSALVRRRDDAAFDHELRLRFLLAFTRQRLFRGGVI